jgi:hypothetical protein
VRQRSTPGSRGSYRLDPVDGQDLAKAILGQVELLLGVARGLLRTAEDASQAIESNRDLVK